MRLVQNLGTPWRVFSETSKSNKLNTSTNEWKIAVPAGGERTLRYAVTFGP